MPKIDRRSYEDIVAQTEQLAQEYTDWQPDPEGVGDAGQALIRLFGRMVAVASDRLNQVPDKNFLAFLDLIGVQRRPPEPARAPLTFYLSAGSTQDALVPAGTSINAELAETDTEAVAFETEQELVVTPAQLQGVFVRDSPVDRFSDRTAQAAGAVETAFPAFQGDRAVEHALYLACDELFGLPGDKVLTVNVTTAQAADLCRWPLTWAYWDGTDWETIVGVVEGLDAILYSNTTQITIQKGRAIVRVEGVDETVEVQEFELQEFELQEVELTEDRLLDLDAHRGSTVLIVISTAVSTGESAPIAVVPEAPDNNSLYPAETYVRLARLAIDDDGVVSYAYDPSGFSQTDWSISLPLAHPEPYTIDGIEARWLRAAIHAPFPPTPQALPTIADLSVAVQVTRTALAVDRCLFNQVPLDLEKDFYPFGEIPQFNDTFYLANGEALAHPGAIVTVTVTVSDPLPYPISPSTDLLLEWAVWTGKIWQPLTTEEALEETLEEALLDGTVNLSQTGTLTFALPEGIVATAVNGETNFWLRGRILRGDYGTDTASSQTATFLRDAASAGAGTLAVYNTRGLMPGDSIGIVVEGTVNETVRIDSLDLGAQTITLAASSPLQSAYPQGTQVLLQLATALGPPVLKSIHLGYSYNSGTQPLTYALAYNDFTAVDRPLALLQEDAAQGTRTLHLTQVDRLAVTTNEEETALRWSHLWIDPNGTNPEFHEVLRVDPTQNLVTVKRKLVHAHSAASEVVFCMGLSLFAQTGDTALSLKTVMGLVVGDRLRLDTAEGEWVRIIAIDPETNRVHLDQALTDGYDSDTAVMREFLPFVPLFDPIAAIAGENNVDDTVPAVLYLGFDRPFSNRAMTVFVQTELPLPAEVALQPDPGVSRLARLTWDYSSPSGWERLDVVDGTQGFSERGTLQFVGPTDFRARSHFGQTSYWLRAVLQNDVAVLPRLQRILTNTIWASQTTSLEQEILGSGNGKPDQYFQTSHTPVLNGQVLEVEEGEWPSEAEQAELARLHGADAITALYDDNDELEAVWVRWQEVSDFYSSDSQDRHYVLEHQSGAIQFGDGSQGRVAPSGLNNLRLTYQSGGGVQGNRDSNTITQLKTTVPYIDRVANLDAATGGAEVETLEQVKVRGPKTLRHRDRAITEQDFVDLAFEASTEVARAQVLPAGSFAPDYTPTTLWIEPETGLNADGLNQAELDPTLVPDAGQVRLLIVPQQSIPQPTPSVALLDKVETYILERCPPTVALQVLGPQWQEVQIAAEIVPTRLDGADAVRAAIIAQLEAFLHPLTGGETGDGWPFGRHPYKSDLYALIEAVPGVDRVQRLQVTPEAAEIPNDTFSNDTLIYSGKHTITLDLT